MRLMKHSIITAGLLAALMVASSCSVMKKAYGISEVEVPLMMNMTEVPEHFRNIDKQVAVTVKSSVMAEDMYNDDVLPKFTRSAMPHYTFTPSVAQFAKSTTTSYMQMMGFDVISGADFSLVIDVKALQFSWTSNKTGRAVASLTYRFVNEAGETIVPSTSVSATAEVSGSETFGAGMGRAYGMALAKINWERIAKSLTIADTPAQEKNAQVSGQGDTALENTIIRWYINSAPQGADVSWRVVSSTPDVKNTNSNYVGSTPYETTESFDIKGLTYNNSGNVQIEITCERPGYLPQKKRFNVRQAIDQKEISAKFNLIKED